MAVRNLPKGQRRKGIIFGTGVAVLLRIILAVFVAMILDMRFVKLIGGILILWIAVKLLIEGEPDEAHGKEAGNLWQAIQIILIADITMSLDNVLAVAGAANNDLFLLIFGLAMSIPIVMFTSDILSKLMERFPVIIIIGGAILGKVGGEMILHDALVYNRLHPSMAIDYAFQAFCAVGVVIAAKLWMKWTGNGLNKA
jgi:YjbE family integral membrane protein